MQQRNQESISSIEDLKRVSAYYFAKYTAAAFRDRLFALSSAACCLRCDTFRALRMCDLMMEERRALAGDLQSCPELILRLHITRSGEPELFGCIRNRSEEVCPIGALGFYFFHRFNTLGEPLPLNDDQQSDFLLNCVAGSHDNAPKRFLERIGGGERQAAVDANQTRRYWTTSIQGLAEYIPDDGIFRVDRIPASLSSVALNKNILSALNDLGLNRGRSKTSCFRKFGVQRHGLLNSKIRVAGYQPGTARRSIMAYAGFDAARNDFHHPRNSIIPSESLQNQVFPQYLALKAKLEQNPAQSLGMVRFFKVLTELRRIILQDAAALLISGKAEYVEAGIFYHPVFRCAEFVEFKNQIAARLALDNRTGEVPPMINDEIFLRLNEASQKRHEIVMARLAAIEAKLDALSKQLHVVRLRVTETSPAIPEKRSRFQHEDDLY